MSVRAFEGTFMGKGAILGGACGEAVEGVRI